MVAVAYPELLTTGMPKVFTTAIFSQFLSLHPRHINGLANKKLENGSKSRSNRRRSAKAGSRC
jgi:hypothetical protein